MPLNHFSARHFRAKHFQSLYGILFTTFIMNAVYHWQTEGNAKYWSEIAFIACFVLNSHERTALFQEAAEAGAVWDYEITVSPPFTEEV